MPSPPTAFSIPAPEPLAGPVARRFAARRFGAGPVTLVLGHGFGTTQQVWRRLLPELSRRHTILTYDLACVDSTAFDPREHRHLADFADDLVNLLGEQGVHDAAFVGHSVSGMIGALASLADPGRLSRLVLLNSSPRYLDDEGYEGGFRREDLDALYAAMQHHYQNWVAGFAPAALGNGPPAAIIEFAGSLTALRSDIALSVARTIFESDLRHILPAIQIPTTVIHTSADLAVPASVADYFRRCLPGVSVVRLETEGHLPHISAPDLVLEALNQPLDLR